MKRGEHIAWKARTSREVHMALHTPDAISMPRSNAGAEASALHPRRSWWGCWWGWECGSFSVG